MKTDKKADQRTNAYECGLCGKTCSVQKDCCGETMMPVNSKPDKEKPAAAKGNSPEPEGSVMSLGDEAEEDG